MQQFETVDDYINSFPDEVRKKLEDMRAAVRKGAPKATEAIKYAMPTLVYEGNLVHFAAAKKHIGFYPAPSGIKEFAAELSGYVTSKGAIQFPMAEKLPLDLVRRITVFRAAENEAKAKAKKKAGK